MIRSAPLLSSQSFQLRWYAEEDSSVQFLSASTIRIVTHGILSSIQETIIYISELNQNYCIRAEIYRCDMIPFHSMFDFNLASGDRFY